MSVAFHLEAPFGISLTATVCRWNKHYFLNMTCWAKRVGAIWAQVSNGGLEPVCESHFCLASWGRGKGQVQVFESHVPAKSGACGRAAVCAGAAFTRSSPPSCD